MDYLGRYSGDYSLEKLLVVTDCIEALACIYDGVEDMGITNLDYAATDLLCVEFHNFIDNVYLFSSF